MLKELRDRLEWFKAFCTGELDRYYTSREEERERRVAQDDRKHVDTEFYNLTNPLNPLSPFFRIDLAAPSSRTSRMIPRDEFLRGLS